MLQGSGGCWFKKHYCTGGGGGGGGMPPKNILKKSCCYIKYEAFWRQQKQIWGGRVSGGEFKVMWWAPTLG